MHCSPIFLGYCLQRLELQLLAARRTPATATEQHQVAQVGLAAGNLANLRYGGTDAWPSMVISVWLLTQLQLPNPVWLRPITNFCHDVIHCWSLRTTDILQHMFLATGKSVMP